MRGKLPDEIIDRKKKGFGIPVGAWLLKDLKDWGEEIFSPESIKDAEIFSVEYVVKLWEEHLSLKKDNRKKLWNLAVFLEWRRNFYKTL